MQTYVHINMWANMQGHPLKIEGDEVFVSNWVNGQTFLTRAEEGGDIESSVALDIPQE